MEPFFNIVGCCNFTEAKSREVYTVLLVISLKLNDACKKMLHLALSTLKSFYLEYCSALLAAQLVRFCSRVYKV